MLANDTFACQDLNECEPPGVCSQTCHNTKGSYTCECAAGYVLENKHNCKVSALLSIMDSGV